MTTTTVPMTGEATTHGRYKNRKALRAMKLDMTKMQSIFTEYARAVYGADANEFTVPEFVLLELAERDHADKTMYALVMSEGVGVKQNERRIFDLWAENWVGTAVNWHVHLSRVLECTTDEYVDVAEFIRTFGDRLESNYELWFHAATVAPKGKN